MDGSAKSYSGLFPGNWNHGGLVPPWQPRARRGLNSQCQATRCLLSSSVGTTNDDRGRFEEQGNACVMLNLHSECRKLLVIHKLYLYGDMRICMRTNLVFPR